MNVLEKLSKKNLASERLWRQMLGALMQWQTKHSMKRKVNPEGGHHEIEVVVL